MKTLEFTTMTKIVKFHISAQANFINSKIKGWIDNYNYFGTSIFLFIILSVQINKKILKWQKSQLYLIFFALQWCHTLPGPFRLA